jgi:putative FmdB family regulatory protein
MPIYEYRCTECGNRVEVLVRSDASAPRCPDCDSVLADKLFSLPNVLKMADRRPAGHTCCGREERCDTPSCSTWGECRHD